MGDLSIQYKDMIVLYTKFERKEVWRGWTQEKLVQIKFLLKYRNT